MYLTLQNIMELLVLAVVALLVPMLSPFFRMRKAVVSRSKDECSTEASEKEANMPVSIVIVEHDSAFRLEKVLPMYLSQNYGADYQVVVVIDQNDSESEDVLKRHSDNPHLYYTTLPVTSRYLSRKKLGITLGMRAAKYDWVIVADVHCAPATQQWLKSFAAHCTEDKRLVLGMTPYEDEAPAYYRFEHLRTMLYFMRSAMKGMAFSTNQSLVALRKSDFFEQKGFGGNLEYTRSEFEFLVNKFAAEGQCDLALEEKSWLTQFNPNKERWLMRHLSALHSFPAMQRRGMFRFLFHLDSWVMHLFNLLMLCLIVLMCLGLKGDMEKKPMNDDEVIADVIFLGVFILLWIITLVERCLLYAPVLKAFSNVHPLSAVFIESFFSLRNFVLRIRYWFTDKNGFITHKL